MSKLNQKLLSEVRRIVRARSAASQDYAHQADKAQALAREIESQGFQVSRSQTHGPDGVLWTVKVVADAQKPAIGIRACEREAIQIAAEKAGATIRPPSPDRES